MNIDEDQAETLFGDDRGRQLDAVDGHHMSIRRRGRTTLVLVDGEQYALSRDELDDVLDDLDCESVWWLLATETTKVVDAIRTRIHDR